MAIQNTLSYSTTFQLNNAPKNFKLSDTTNYAAEGIALADVVGIFKIVDPTGATVYENTNFGAPDIDADVSLDFDTVSIPLDASGNPIEGTYAITYTIRVSGAVQPGDYPLTNSLAYSYTAATAALEVTVDYICSKITSTDNTPYQVGTTIVLRTHTLHPPDGSGLTDTVGSTQIISTSPITNKTWTAEIDTDISVVLIANLLIVEDTIVGTVERQVDMGLSQCNINCCLQSVMDQYLAALSSNPLEASRIKEEQLEPALMNQIMFQTTLECGLPEKAEVYYNNVLKYSQCNPECTCEDSDVPTLIQPLCAGSGGTDVTVVDACGTNSALTVTSNTVGDTTTYTVCYDQALYTKLSGLNSQYIVTSADASVTVVTSTDANNIKTFDLSTGGTSTPSIVAQRIETTLATGLLPSVVVDKDTLYGTLLQKPTVVSDNIGGGYGTWSPLNNCWTISAYNALAGGLDVKPTLQVTKLVDAVGTAYDCDKWTDLCVKIISIDYATGEIKYRYSRENGQQLTNQSLIDNYTIIELSLTLTA